MGFVQDLMERQLHIDKAELLQLNTAENIAVRPRLENLHIEEGVLEKLHGMLYVHGPANGTALFMPFDQKSSEHGPGHEFLWSRDNPSPEEINERGKGSADIRTIAELVNRGNYSGYVLHPGNISQAKNLFNPDIPLIYKIDGTISQPAGAGIPSTVGSIDDALRHGASAIGMTLYPGSEYLRDDLERVGELTQKAHNAGLAVVVWAYARGPGLDSNFKFKNKNGDEIIGQTQADSLYWTQYAVAIASGFIGADIVKTKFPAQVKDKNRPAYDAYIESLAEKNSSMIAYKFLEPENSATPLTNDQHIYRASLVVQTAPHAIVIFSGGPKVKGDPTESVLRQTEIILKAGAEGGIYGRNVWGIPVEHGLELSEKLVELMKSSEYSRKLTQPRFAGYIINDRAS